MISQEYMLSSLLLNIILDVLAKAVGQAKEINPFRFERSKYICIYWWGDLTCRKSKGILHKNY